MKSFPIDIVTVAHEHRSGGHEIARRIGERLGWPVLDDAAIVHGVARRMGVDDPLVAALVAWPEITLRLLPKYAAWLNLIEPWWKTLRALALKGRRFETLGELEAALRDALAYWNAHRHPYRWRKFPQQQPAPAVHT